MKNYKLLLYAIYFLLLNINKMSFKDVSGNNNITYIISLILITLSIVSDLSSIIKIYRK